VRAATAADKLWIRLTARLFSAEGDVSELMSPLSRRYCCSVRRAPLCGVTGWHTISVVTRGWGLDQASSSQQRAMRGEYVVHVRLCVRVAPASAAEVTLVTMALICPRYD
jgi:hypothetical protein